MSSVSKRARAKRYGFVTVAAAGAALAMLGSSYAFANNGGGGGDSPWNDTELPSYKGIHSMNSVEALGQDNVFAVGGAPDAAGKADDADTPAAAAHWNGEKWTETAAPNGTFESVSGGAGEKENVWAVGFKDDGNLTAHWTGKKWKEVETPAPKVANDLSPKLKDVAVSQTGDDPWAVGCAESEDGNKSSAFAQQWNGKEWKLTELPKPEGMDNTCLNSIESEGTYAVGRASNGEEQGVPYIVKWDGKKWNLVDTPKLKDADAGLNGVVNPAVGRDGKPELSVAGFSSEKYGDSENQKPLMMTYDGDKWNQYDTSDVKGVLTDVGPCGEIVCAAGHNSEGKGVLATFEGGKGFPAEGPSDEDDSSYNAVDFDNESGQTWVVGDRGGKAGMAAYRDSSEG